MVLSHEVVAMDHEQQQCEAGAYDSRRSAAPFIALGHFTFASEGYVQSASDV